MYLPASTGCGHREPFVVLSAISTEPLGAGYGGGGVDLGLKPPQSPHPRLLIWFASREYLRVSINTQLPSFNMGRLCFCFILNLTPQLFTLMWFVD